MRMRKKPNLIPRLAAVEGLILKQDKVRDFIKSECQKYEYVELELGCGKGAFTMELAKLKPNSLILALEKVPEAAVVAMERINAEGLNNVRFLLEDAAELCEFLDPSSVDRIYINFPDPWKKKKQWKRRLTHPDFLRLYKKILKPGAEIHFKTDNEPLFDWSCEIMPTEGFEIKNVNRDLHADGVCGIMSDYESKFHMQGLPIYRLEAYIK